MCEYDQSIPFAKLVPHLCYVIGKTNKKNPNAYVQLKSKKKTILSEKSLLFKSVGSMCRNSTNPTIKQ